MDPMGVLLASFLQDFDCSCPRCCELWDRSRGVRCQCGHIRFLDVAGATGKTSRKNHAFVLCSQVPSDWELPYKYSYWMLLDTNLHVNCQHP